MEALWCRTGVSFTCIANVVNWAMNWHPGVEIVLGLVFVTNSCTLASGIDVSGLLSHQLMPLGGEISAVRGQRWTRSLFGTRQPSWKSLALGGTCRSDALPKLIIGFPRGAESEDKSQIRREGKGGEWKGQQERAAPFGGSPCVSFHVLLKMGGGSWAKRRSRGNYSVFS